MSIEQLLEDGVIDEALGRLKSGKEADVWLVRHHDEVLCAKVYKERHVRSFKNNAGYKEGRAVRNTRTQRAIDKGSRFGQAAAEQEWKAAESDALHKLHAQGVRVPAPVLFYEGILLMKLVLDAEGHPAPRLIEAQLTPEQARAFYEDLRAQVVKMLSADLIHGDLSPYNVLLGAEGPTIIDFPQVVSAAQNSTAESFFKRDVENLRNFFAGVDPSLLQRTGDAQEIWRAYVRRELTPDFVPSGKPQPEARPHHGHGQRNGPRPQHGDGQRPHGQQQHAPRPHGQQQNAPRPHGQQQHAPRPHGQQQLAPRPHGQQQHAPRHGQQPPAPRPHGQPPAPRPHGQPPAPRPHGQQHAPRPDGHPQRPHGQHHAPRPHGQQHPSRPQGQQHPRQGSRPPVVVERVQRVPHPRRPPQK